MPLGGTTSKATLEGPPAPNGEMSTLEVGAQAEPLRRIQLGHLLGEGG